METALEDIDYFWNCGCHRDAGVVRRLTEHSRFKYFGTSSPSRMTFEIASVKAHRSTLPFGRCAYPRTIHFDEARVILGDNVTVSCLRKERIHLPIFFSNKYAGSRLFCMMFGVYVVCPWQLSAFNFSKISRTENIFAAVNQEYRHGDGYVKYSQEYFT